MRGPVGALDRYWMAPAPPQRLAMLRVLVGAYALVYLLVRTPHLLAYAHFDPGQFDPVGVVALLPRPLTPALVQALVLAAVAAALPFVLGWRHRISGPAFAALLLWVLSYSNSWGQILHTDNLLVLDVLVLACVPAADALSLDARRRAEGSGPASRERYGWPIRLLCVLCVASYLLAGIAKLEVGGLDFLEGETLRNHVAFDNVRKLELGSVHSPIGAWLLPYEPLFVVLAGFSLALELGAPLALLHRRVGVLWCLLVWGFHVGVLALMAIAFVYPLTGIAFAPFFRVERLLERRPLRRWARRAGIEAGSG